MLKLLKQEWKIYLFFGIATSLLILWQTHTDIFQFVEYHGDGMYEMVNQGANGAYRYLAYFGSDIYTFLRGTFLQIICCSFLIQKGMRYLVETNHSGRAYIMSLPLKKNDAIKLHFAMDAILLLVYVLVYLIYLYINMQNLFFKYNMEIPWGASSLVGMGITIYAYILMILGGMYVVEAVFVNGYSKIIIMLGTAYLVDLNLWQWLSSYRDNKFLQNIYGFLKLYLPANYHYVVDKCGPFDNVAEIGWQIECIMPPLYLNGNLAQINEKADLFSDIWDYEGFSLLYNYSNISNYIGYAFAYAIIGILLFLWAKYMVEKREAWKDTTYFEFAKYVWSGFAVITLFFLMYELAEAIWHKALVVAACVLLYVLIIWLMKRDNLKEKKKVHEI